jgi:hypothetical protein
MIADRPVKTPRRSQAALIEATPPEAFQCPIMLEYPEPVLRALCKFNVLAVRALNGVAEAPALNIDHRREKSPELRCALGIACIKQLRIARDTRCGPIKSR